MSMVSHKLGMFTAALVPFIWSVVIHSGNTPTPLSISIPDRPALAFRQYAVDLGPIQPTVEARATFIFVNRGKSPVEVKQVIPSCSCLVPRINRGSIVHEKNSINDSSRDDVANLSVEQRRFEPGEDGRIVLRVQPANESSGPKELFADLTYNDPEPRQVRLTFKLEIPKRQMTVTPSSLMFFHPRGSEATTSSFTVADGRKKPFDIVEVVVNSELVSTAIGERKLSQTGEWSQNVEVTVAGELPEGRQQALLRIRTTDPDYKELRVPLMLVGPLPEGVTNDEDHEHTKHVRVGIPE